MFGLICLHIIYYKSNEVYIGIGIGISNFVADISVIGISVKTHIGAPLLGRILMSKGRAIGCSSSNYNIPLQANSKARSPPHVSGLSISSCLWSHCKFDKPVSKWTDRCFNICSVHSYLLKMQTDCFISFTSAGNVPSLMSNSMI